MKIINSKKNTGSYYTPPTLSDFIIFHLFSNYQFKKNIKMLEPSVGDGVFFDSIFENKTFPNFNVSKYIGTLEIEAIEIEREAMDVSKKKTDSYLKKNQKITYFNEDYLDYNNRNEKKFDLIIGNPPYIKNHHLTKKQIKLCEEIQKKSNLGLKKIKNIWPSFLIAGAQSLNEDGILCFVLPAELLQVIYAKELRDFLRDNFKKIEIFAFNELVFPSIEQDVIILICAKKQTPGVSFYQVNKLDDLKKPTYVKENSNIHRETLDKWTNYVLSDAELKFLDSIKKKLLPIKSYCRAEVGIVTAANDFFIINESTVKEFKLAKITEPILQKSSLMSSTVEFIEDDYKKIIDSGKPAFLLVFENKKTNDFPANFRNYIKRGERLKLHKRYKCQLRENWYFIPSVWKSEGFFTKRSDLIPKMTINKANVMVTDAFYRIRMKEENKVEDLVFSFYNTLTLIFAELEGRYYGGGVLELTPNEYKNLSIPYYRGVSKKLLNKLDNLLRGDGSIRDILNFTDQYILKDNLKLSDKDILKLRNIYFKLLKRRLKKFQKRLE